MKIRVVARNTLVGLLVLAILSPFLFWAARAYVKQRIVAELQRQLEARVKIERLEVNFQRIRLHEIRVSDEDSDERWLSIRSVTPDISLWDVLQGRTNVDSLVVLDPRLTLQFGAQGELLTRLPSSKQGEVLPFKAIEIENAELEINQAGRGKMQARQIEASLRHRDSRFEAAGTVGDFLGSDWSFSSSGQLQPLDAALKVGTEEIQIASDDLSELPLVDPNRLADLPFDVSTSLQANVSFRAPDTWRYRLAAAFESLSVDLPDGPAEISSLSGSVVLEDGRLTVEQLVGQLAGGRLRISGNSDFRTARWTGNLICQLDGVDLATLPLDERLPPETSGVASGTADIGFSYESGELMLSGIADAIIDPLSLFGDRAQPARIHVNLREATQSEPSGAWSIDGVAGVELAWESLDLHRWLSALCSDNIPIVPPQCRDAAGRVHLTLPLATVMDPLTFEAEGDFSLAGLQWSRTVQRKEGATRGPFSDANADSHWSPLMAMTRLPDVDRLDGRFTLNDGIVTLDQFVADLKAGGQLSGTSQAELREGGQLKIDLDAQGVPADSSLGVLFDEPSISGRLAAGVVLQVATADWSRWDAWTARGTIAGQQLAYQDHRLDSLQSGFSFGDKKIEFSKLVAVRNATRLLGSGSLRLVDQMPFSSQFEVPDIAIAEAADLVGARRLATDGNLQLRAEVTGSLQPLSWNVTGRAAVSDFNIADVTFRLPEFNWKLGPRQLEITDVRAQALQANLRLAAVVPIEAEEPIRLKGSFSDVGQPVIRRFLPESRIELIDPAEGEFDLSLRRDRTDLNTDFAMSAPGIEFRGVAVSNARATGSVLNERLDVKVTGETLGGRFELDGGAEIASFERREILLQGNLKAQNLRLSPLFQALQIRSRAGLPSGSVSADMQWKVSGQELQPSGKGVLQFRDLRWQDRNLAAEINSQAEFNEDRLVMSNAGFGYGGGRIQADLDIRLDRNLSGTYQMAIENVRADALLSAWPELSREARSRIEGRFQGDFTAARITGRGQIAVDRGAIQGIPVANIQMPVSWTLDPATGAARARLKVRRATVSRGKMSGDVDISWNRRFSINSKMQLTNVDVRPIARNLQRLSNQWGGRLSGQVEIRGRDINSLADLSGSYQFTLANSQVFRLPVLQALPGSFILASPGESFRETRMQGRVHRGIVFVDRMTMVAAGLHMFIQGKVTTQGQLNLDVTADTAELAAAGIAAGLLRPTDFLRRRLIFLHVSGTNRAPIVTPRTDKLLAQEVELFFLTFLLL